MQYFKTEELYCIKYGTVLWNKNVLIKPSLLLEFFSLHYLQQVFDLIFLDLRVDFVLIANNWAKFFTLSVLKLAS